MLVNVDADAADKAEHKSRHIRAPEDCLHHPNVRTYDTVHSLWVHSMGTLYGYTHSLTHTVTPALHHSVRRPVRRIC